MIIEEVKKYGFKTLSIALRNNSIEISDPLLKEVPPIGIIMGTEGEELDPEVISSTSYVVKIPLHHNVDSHNVDAACAIVFRKLRK
ncbi:MAG: hypothetical protein K2M88_03780 [Muribaculaceae bacterium]|nr:hypothetical protein [Muribaculaceae bacterium]